MKNTLRIAKRELGAYFASPIAYVVTAAYLLVMGVMFALIINSPNAQAYMDIIYGNVYSFFILVIIAPLLTMRLLAEEYRSGTIELLLTAPVRDWEVVVGKYIASWLFFLFMLAPTLYYYLILEYASAPDRGAVFSIYLGMILFGGALLSIGLFASALSPNQIVAAVVGFAIILILMFLQYASSNLDPPLSEFLYFISPLGHFFDFLKGIIDTKDVVYYLSIVAGMLFLTAQVLNSRRWS